MRPVLALLAGALVCTGLVIIATLAFEPALEGARVQTRDAHPLLPLKFAHADHREEDCSGCHHNFIDDTGVGSCLDCHKRDAALAEAIEVQFHDLCRGCHVEKQLAGHEHGPTRQCALCHVTDDKP